MDICILFYIIRDNFAAFIQIFNKAHRWCIYLKYNRYAIPDNTKQSNTIPICNGKLKTILIGNGYCTFNV